MTLPDGIRPRVILGNLEPLVRLGFNRVLEEEGAEVVGEEERPAALVRMAGRLQPDLVVLDLGQVTSQELGARVRRAAPATTVILWARDEDRMEVHAPGAERPRRYSAAVGEELRSELCRVHGNRAEE